MTAITVETDQAIELILKLDAELSAILAFWKNNMTDLEKGGFHGRIDGFNRSDPAAPRGVVLNARILWTFSAACNLGKPEAETARMAFEALQKFLDPQHGGVYWAINRQGGMVSGKKQIYAQAFAIYALSEYFRFCGDEKALNQAIELFRLIERFSFDTEKNGYYEAFDREWNLLEDLRLSDKDANEKKTMNTHLHVLEAYANLYRVWPDEQLKKQLVNLTSLFLDKILDPQTGHLNLFFDEVWNLKSRVYSYGHDIEAGWLLTDAAVTAGDQAIIRRVEKAAMKIYETTLHEGIDVDGGLFNEGSAGKVVDTDKHWWPQAEALVGFLHAFELTGDAKFLNAAGYIWQFIDHAIIDHKRGEWFFRVNRTWTPYVEEDKAGFWKCPYHNSRACMEGIMKLKGGS